MRGFDLFFAIEVSDRARDLEDLVMRAGGKAQLFNGGIEEFPGLLVEPGVFPELLRGHPGIHDRRGPRKTLFLDAPGAGRPDADAFGAFSFRRDIKFPGGQGRQFHMDVDAVQERSGQAVEIAGDFGRGAAARTARVGQVTAGTRGSSSISNSFRT